MFPREQLDPDSDEMSLIYRAIEKVRKEEAELFNKNPRLLVDEVRKIADEHPEIIKEYGETYFIAFAVGVLVERYDISIETVAKAISAWSSKS